MNLKIFVYMVAFSSTLLCPNMNIFIVHVFHYHDCCVLGDLCERDTSLFLIKLEQKRGLNMQKTWVGLHVVIMVHVVY